MTRVFFLTLLVLLLAAPVAGAATFTEDFEGFDQGGLSPETKPDQDWYDYREGSDVGTVTVNDPIINGEQSFRLDGPVTPDVSNKHAHFQLELAAQIVNTTFFIQGTPPSVNGAGSQQVVRIQSVSPVRTMVEFYVFCQDSSFPSACELRVRFDPADSTGQTLINTTVGQTRFKIQVIPDWKTAEFQLFVDDVDDGVFPFLQLPSNFGRLRFEQYRPDVPMLLTLDDWTVGGAIEGNATAVDADAAEGVKNFADNIRFTTAGSKFALGIVIFIVMVAAVLVPLLALGMDNTIVPAMGLYVILAALWLVEMEFWPDWVGIALIIAVAAVASLAVRRGIMGLKDAGRGPALVAGSLGYFIIASSFLAFSGYAEFNVTYPTGDLGIDEEEDEGLPENETFKQNFVEAVVDCSIGIVTIGFFGDCSRDTRGKAVQFASDVVDTIGRITATIFNYARVAFTFLFQLVTFQLPIPLIFNMMVVLPPAVALVTLAFQSIRGVS